jgi:glycosyltransferase involved in cell wall biosynthesis
MSAIRVLHVTGTLVGHEDWLIRLPEHIGPDVQVSAYVTSGLPDDPSPLTGHGLRVTAGPLGTSRVRRLAALAAHIRRERPDVVHAHLEYETAVVAVAHRLAGSGAAVLMHMHNTARLAPGTLLHRAQRLAMRRADLILCGSRAVADDQMAHYGVSPARTRVWYLGVHLDHLDRVLAEARPDPGPAGEWLTLVFAGRLVPLKGVDILLRAVARLGGCPVRLLVVGEGPERPCLEAMAQDLGLCDRVSFLGQRTHEEVYRALAGAHLYVHAARHEALGFTILEAMASGLPVVATAVEGIPEAVADGQSGLLVPPESPEALAQAIGWMLDHENERQAMGQAGRRIVEQRFSMAVRAVELEGIYHELAQARASRTA